MYRLHLAHTKDAQACWFVNMFFHRSPRLNRGRLLPCIALVYIAHVGIELISAVIPVCCGLPLAINFFSLVTEPNNSCMMNTIQVNMLTGLLDSIGRKLLKFHIKANQYARNL